VLFDVVSEGLVVLVIDIRVEHVYFGGEYVDWWVGCEVVVRVFGVAMLCDVVEVPLDETLCWLLYEELCLLVCYVVIEIGWVFVVFIVVCDFYELFWYLC